MQPRAMVQVQEGVLSKQYEEYERRPTIISSMNVNRPYFPKHLSLNTTVNSVLLLGYAILRILDPFQGAVLVFHSSPSILTLESAVAGSLNPLLLPLRAETSSLIRPEPTLTVRASAEFQSDGLGGSPGRGRLALTRSIFSSFDSCFSDKRDLFCRVSPMLK